MSKNPPIHLICFPFAGGANTAFLPLQSHLKNDFQVSVVNYPGRGKRMRESLITDLELLVEDTWQQIRSQLSEPYILYGHSMGATIAFLIAHRIQQENRHPPTYLLLSGKECPTALADEQEHLLSTTAFKEVLNTYGGIPKEILENEEFFSFFEPIIRTDMQAIETWEYVPKSTLSIPTTIMNGVLDDLTEDEIVGWQKEFSNTIQYENFPGGHFFINEHSKEVADYMLKTIHSKVSV